MKIDRGTVVQIDLDPTLGHERRGTRPCIVVSDPEVTEDQRFPMLCVVPITKTPGEGALYPEIQPAGSGLRFPSTVLIDQVRSIDKRRVTRVFGGISKPDLGTVDDALAIFLGLNRYEDPTTDYA